MAAQRAASQGALIIAVDPALEGLHLDLVRRLDKTSSSNGDLERITDPYVQELSKRHHEIDLSLHLSPHNLHVQETDNTCHELGLMTRTSLAPSSSPIPLLYIQPS